MEKIFEVEDKTGRIIYLPKKQWLHIASEHPEVGSKYERIIETIIETIIEPLFINNHNKDENVKYYHKRYKENDKYLIVVVKYLNGEGFIVSSYYTNKAQP